MTCHVCGAPYKREDTISMALGHPITVSVYRCSYRAAHPNATKDYRA